MWSSHEFASVFCHLIVLSFNENCGVDDDEDDAQMRNGKIYCWLAMVRKHLTVCDFVLKIYRTLSVNSMKVIKIFAFLSKLLRKILKISWKTWKFDEKFNKNLKILM